MARGVLGVLAGAVVLLVCPSWASAAQLFAAPNGDNVSACTPGNPPCEIHRAFNLANSNDEVIVMTGDYGSEGAPLPGQIAAVSSVNVHGEDGAPRPRIFIDVGNDTSGMKLGLASTVRHLEVHLRPVVMGGSRQAALEINGGEATDIVATNTASQGRACVLLGTSLLRNSLCVASGPNDTYGVTTFTGVGPGGPNNSVIRNVTAIAPSPAGYGIRAFAGNNLDDDQSLTVTNTIARGGLVGVGADNAPGGLGTAMVTIDHSNFGFESSAPSGSGDRVVDGPGGGNQRTFNPGFAPQFVADDLYFHQAPGSVTIDAGADSVDNGSTDFDGDARTLGVRTDIGADEFVPPPDSDGDGVPDPSDSCPSVPAQTASGCPPGQGPGETPPDTEPPVITLGGKQVQKADGTIEVTASCDTDCGVDAGGKLTVISPSGGGGGKLGAARRKFNLRGDSESIAAGKTVTLDLKLTRKAKRAATSALKRGGRARARIAVTAADAAGNTAAASRGVRLKLPKRR